MSNYAIPVIGDVAKKGVKTIRKLHGSPYKFDFPNMEHYKSGEGGGGYGYGFHVTDHPDTAKEYATSIPTIIIDGVETFGNENINAIAADVIDNGYKSVERKIKGVIKENPELPFPKKRLELLRTLKNASIQDARGGGVVYDIDIKEGDINTYLNFQDSLKNQNKEVIKALEDNGLLFDKSISGEDLYYQLSESLGGDKEASEFLDRSGIKGIKYKDKIGDALDDVESGNFNYTVFDPRGIESSAQKNPVKIITGNKVKK